MENTDRLTASRKEAGIYDLPFRIPAPQQFPFSTFLQRGGNVDSGYFSNHTRRLPSPLSPFSL